MTNFKEIDPLFDELLLSAWGGYFGNVRIIGKGSPPRLTWHLELDGFTQGENDHAFFSTTGFMAGTGEAKKSDTGYVGVLWVDIDSGTLPEPQDLFATPNFIIHTSPGKGHLFYVIDPVTIQSPKDIDLLESVQSSLSSHLGGDKGSRDLGHISRIPGSINPKNGHLVTIEKLHDEIYRLSDLNPNALSPGEGRHHDAIKKLTAVAAKGDDIEEAMTTLETVAYTEPFGSAERAGIIRHAENADVRQFAPEPVEGINVSAHTGEKAATVAEHMKALEAAGADVAHNVMGGRVMFNGAMMTDSLFSVIFAHMESKGYRKQNSLDHALNALAHDNDTYNPIIRWIDKNRWDGKDHIAHLAGHFEDEAGDFEPFLRHFLVGSIAKLLEPTGAFNRMLVLEGPQGMGKSYFVNWLVPPAMEEYYCSDPLDPEDKDASIKATEKWIWELQEVEGVTTTRDQAKLKGFLSQKKTSVRKPYAKYAMNENVRASFIGTLNDITGFLTDSTGNRRYMAVSLTYIDWAYQKDVDVRQVWAQALAMYRSDMKWELKGEILSRADEANESFMAYSPLVEVLEGLFVVDPEDYSTSMSIKDVMDCLPNDGRKPPTSREVGAALTQMGANRARKTVHGKKVRLWVGIKPRQGVGI